MKVKGIAHVYERLVAKWDSLNPEKDALSH